MPNDPESPFITSGVRIGTPAVTTRGFKEEEMKLVGKLIKLACVDFENNFDYVKMQVEALTKKFPLYQ